MSNDIIETLFGKLHKYEIRVVSTFLSRKFVIYRDGKRWRGQFSSLSEAVKVAREAG